MKKFKPKQKKKKPRYHVSTCLNDNEKIKKFEMACIKYNITKCAMVKASIEFALENMKGVK